MYTPRFVADCNVQFANIVEVSILPGFDQLLLLFQMFACDQDDTAAPKLSVLQSKQYLSHPRYTQHSVRICWSKTMLSTLARS